GGGGGGGGGGGSQHGGGGGGHTGPHWAAAESAIADTARNPAAAGSHCMIRTPMGRPPDESIRSPRHARSAPDCI
ncbi:MAG: hypothetical protein ACT6TH_07130, partial [Brevundimonas sp.]